MAADASTVIAARKTPVIALIEAPSSDPAVDISVTAATAVASHVAVKV